jgi:YesN/AraC family two-component response regulator
MRTPGQFDAILTDLWREREDVGLELARSASQLKPRPIVVIFTGYGSTSNARAALGVPVDYFALKPLDVDELKRVLNRLVMANFAGDRWRP